MRNLCRFYHEKPERPRNKKEEARVLNRMSSVIARSNLGYSFHSDCEITFDDTVEKEKEMAGVSLFFQPPPAISY